MMTEESQKKYTVYEIEKLTKGKLSKYKLTKAIEQGLLKAERVKRTKKGRGVPNFFVFENDLYDYLKYIDENKKKYISVPEGDLSNSEEPSEIDQNQIIHLLEMSNLQLNQQSAAIEQLQKQLDLLVLQQKQVLKNDLEKSQNRKVLLDQLEKIGNQSNSHSFKVEKREQIINDLISLS
jgi:endo-1,4-beta-mannosidase